MKSCSLLYCQHVDTFRYSHSGLLWSTWCMGAWLRNYEVITGENSAMPLESNFMLFLHRVQLLRTKLIQSSETSKVTFSNNLKIIWIWCPLFLNYCTFSIWKPQSPKKNFHLPLNCGYPLTLPCSNCILINCFA